MGESTSARIVPRRMINNMAKEPTELGGLEIDRAAIEAKASALVHAHIEAINAGDREAVSRHLFHPAGTRTEPLSVYADAMVSMGPMVVKSLQVTRFEPPKAKRHGLFATIWIDIVVLTGKGVRTAEVTVWWDPTTDGVILSSRPTHWVLEYLRSRNP